MSGKPILFQRAMVRAILEGRKTMTRRALKFIPSVEPYSPICQDGVLYNYAGDEIIEKCRYGKPGSRLWVREALVRRLPAAGPCVVHYRATEPDVPGPWRPSIHMARMDSRINLEITGIRVEHLHDITEEDAKAEGVEPLDFERYAPDFDKSVCGRCGGTGLYTAFGANLGALPDSDCYECDTHKKRFRNLWAHINGADSWDANPLVWVVAFKRAANQGDAS